MNFFIYPPFLINLFILLSTSSQPSPIEEKEHKRTSSPLRYELACEANDLKRIEVR